VRSRGETEWVWNQVRWADRADAAAWGQDTYVRRWNADADVTVKPSRDNPSR
jgi:hypothetical protein